MLDDPLPPPSQGFAEMNVYPSACRLSIHPLTICIYSLMQMCSHRIILIRNNPHSLTLCLELKQDLIGYKM